MANLICQIIQSDDATLGLGSDDSLRNLRPPGMQVCYEAGGMWNGYRFWFAACIGQGNICSRTSQAQSHTVPRPTCYFNDKQIEIIQLNLLFAD